MVLRRHPLGHGATRRIDGQLHDERGQACGVLHRQELHLQLVGGREGLGDGLIEPHQILGEEMDSAE